MNVPGAPAATTLAGGTAATVVPSYTLAAADIVKIKNVVAAAAGIDPTRGDQISVEAIPFAPLPEPVVERVQTIFGLPVSVLVAVGLVTLLGIAGFVAMRMRPAPGRCRRSERITVV